MASLPDSSCEVDEIAVAQNSSEAGDQGESPEPEPREARVSASPEGAEAAAWPEDQLERAVAALLFASSEPLSNARIATVLEHTTPAHVAAALDRISARLVSSGLPFELVAIAGGWQLFSARDMADVVARFAKVKREDKVSPAALETLAVVAYRQPVTKAEIEAVRGVQVGPILRTLVDRGLVKVAGRSDDPGHALLYVTTRKFLDTFGLADLQDLPRDAELVRDS
ncbi:MAG: SMC-Scp complex subunit ScpB [Planctomycetota bacterium]